MVKLKWLQRVGCLFVFFCFFGGVWNLGVWLRMLMNLLAVFLCVSTIFDRKTYKIYWAYVFFCFCLLFFSWGEEFGPGLVSVSL